MDEIKKIMNTYLKRDSDRELFGLSFDKNSNNINLSG
jgi:hypothetical protein